MDFTPSQLDILFNAHALARDGCGQVLEDWAVPDAHMLAEQGWLERRFVDGDLAWFWTRQADTALDMAELMTAHIGREN
jgi:hypothetical protein